MRFHINLLALIIFSTPVLGQFVFEPSVIYINGKTVNSGSPIGCADMNSDGLDDLIVLDRARDIYIIYQTNGFGSFYEQFVETVSQDRAWAVAVADINEDDTPDLLAASSSSRALFFGEGVIPEYRRGLVPGVSFLPQSANFADFNGDNILDIFICNDNGLNFTGINNGTGGFTGIDTIMDFSTDPPSDFSGNYGSVFSDFDRDGDLDFYLSKCRLGTIFGDPERINQFFRKTDTGYVRIYDYPEMLSGYQSWAADFIDIENDGDWDLLVANHDGPSELFVQDENGDFKLDTTDRGVDFTGGVIQIISEDFDNDGDVDILIVGDDHFLLENDGNGYFADGEMIEFLDRQIESATVGDFNSDGRLDIYAGYANLYNSPSNIPDEMFMNRSPIKNYIRFNLKGEISNSNAIGATIEIFHKENRQMREIRAGESYGIQTSHIAHFGLDTISRVDSVMILWPSGLEQWLYNLSANRNYFVREGFAQLVDPGFQIIPNESFYCQNDTIQLTAPVGDEYLWSTGENSRTIAVSEPGLYGVSVRRNNFWRNAPAFQVRVESTETPEVLFSGSFHLCSNDSLRLSASENSQILWSNGRTGNSIHVADTGQYFYVATRNCGSYFSDTITITKTSPEKPITEGDTVVRGMSAVLVSSESNTVWVADTISGIALSRGSIFHIDTLKNDSTLFAATFEPTPFEIESVGEAFADVNSDGYHSPLINGGLRFVTHEDCLIRTVTVYARLSGERRVLILNEEDEEVFGKTFDVIVGWNVLELNAEVMGGQNFVMTTDTSVNQASLGFNSPDFIRSANVVEYPYIGKRLSISSSTFTTGQYYYFYNWQVSEPIQECRSFYVPTFAILDSISATEEYLEESSISVYPNPTSGDVNVQFDASSDWHQLLLVNSNGQICVDRKILGTTEVEIKWSIPGLYFIIVTNHAGKQEYLRLLISN